MAPPPPLVVFIAKVATSTVTFPVIFTIPLFLMVILPFRVVGPVIVKSSISEVTVFRIVVPVPEVKVTLVVAAVSVVPIRFPPKSISPLLVLASSNSQMASFDKFDI